MTYLSTTILDSWQKSVLLNIYISKYLSVDVHQKI